MVAVVIAVAALTAGRTGEREATPVDVAPGPISVFDQPLTARDRALQERVRRAVDTGTDPSAAALASEGLPSISRLRVAGVVGHTTIVMSRDARGTVCVARVNPAKVNTVKCQTRTPTGLNPIDNPFSLYRTFVFGLIHNGTDTVTAIFRDGTTQDYPVQDNVVIIPTERLPYPTLVGARYDVRGKLAEVPLDFGDVRLRRVGLPFGSANVRLDDLIWYLTIGSRVYHQLIGGKVSVWVRGTGPRKLRLRPGAVDAPRFSYQAPPDPSAYDTIVVRKGDRPAGEVLFAGPVPPEPVPPPG